MQESNIDVRSDDHTKALWANSVTITEWRCIGVTLEEGKCKVAFVVKKGLLQTGGPFENRSLFHAPFAAPGTEEEKLL